MEYHKIETLYERDEKTFRLKPELILKNRVYGIIKSWIWTEKVDGTNIRCIWDHAKGLVTFGGKTDNAQIPADLVAILYATVTVDKFRAIFPDVDAVVYAEGYGPGIQKGGGDYRNMKGIIVFDVLVDGQWWLSDENMRDVATKLGVDAVPLVGEMPLEEAAEYVRIGFKSKCAVNPAKDAEGLVGRPVEALFDKKGHRLIVKLKTKDFANSGQALASSGRNPQHAFPEEGNA